AAVDELAFAALLLGFNPCLQVSFDALDGPGTADGLRSAGIGFEAHLRPTPRPFAGFGILPGDQTR
ncbi:MAG: hypothetical protein ACREP9_17300, partial [Candidatus Dormibacteraceae bacterium]